MEFFKEDYISIVVPDGTNQVHVEWWGMPSADQYKLGCDKVLEAANQQKTTTLLINYYSLEAYLDLEVQVWTINVWFDQVLKVGISKIGVLIPAKIMAQMVIKSIFAGVPTDTIELSFFEDNEDMMSWVGSTAMVGTATSTAYHTTPSPAPTSSAPIPVPPPPPMAQQKANDQPSTSTLEEDSTNRDASANNNSAQPNVSEEKPQPSVSEEKPQPFQTQQNPYAPPSPPPQAPPPFNPNS